MAQKFMDVRHETLAARVAQNFFHAVGVGKIPEREMAAQIFRPAHAREDGHAPAVKQAGDEIRFHFGDGFFQMARGARRPEIFQPPAFERRLADVRHQALGHEERMQVAGADGGLRVQSGFVAIPPVDFF